MKMLPHIGWWSHEDLARHGHVMTKLLGFGMHFAELEPLQEGSGNVPSFNVEAELDSQTASQTMRQTGSSGAVTQNIMFLLVKKATSTQA